MQNKTWFAAALICASWAALADPLPPILHKAAALQCDGRKIDLQADCFSYIDEDLACTRQRLVFADAASKKQLGERIFKARPKEDGDDYPIIEEKFGALACVETRDKEKFVVATMDNGGNCGSCEWHDVYTLDGALVGSDRDRKKKIKAVGDAVGAVYDKQTRRVFGKNELVDFYVQRAKK
jgi:hypothetical protein